jgi:GST-like protein
MIELYTWSTPNGQKASIMLEEVGLPYRVHPIDIGKDQQFHPDFLAISPNNKIPAIIDTDNGLRLMESERSCFISRRRPASFGHRTSPPNGAWSSG